MELTAAEGSRQLLVFVHLYCHSAQMQIAVLPVVDDQSRSALTLETFKNSPILNNIFPFIALW